MFLSGFAACLQNQTVGSGQGGALMNNPVNGSKLEALEEQLSITRVFITYIDHYAFPVCKPNNNQNRGNNSLFVKSVLTPQFAFYES